MSIAGLVLVIIVLAACLPVIMSENIRGRAAYDSLNYHEKTIRQFAQELPSPNLHDYLSATTPGYHLTLATVGRAVGGIGSQGKLPYDVNLTPQPPDPRLLWERKLLQVVGLSFTLLMLYIAGHWAERRLSTNPFEPAPALAAIALSLPLLGSPYIFQSAVWLLPDNSAWLGVLAILLIALRSKLSVGAVVSMGLILLCLVLTRQIHVWTAGLMWLSTWLGASLPASRDGDHGALLALQDMIIPRPRRAVCSMILLAIACSIPAVLALASLWVAWGGHLVPPSFIAWHPARLQAAAPAFILALIALASPFFVSWIWKGATSAWQSHRTSMIMAFGGAVLLALIPPTAWDFERGRFGGVWTAYKLVGSVGRRSFALAVLAPLGAVVVVAALAGMGVRQRWLMLAALCGFATANSVNPQLWQRYHEPFVLIWLIVAAALCAVRQTAPDSLGFVRTWKLAGPMMLAIILALTNAVMILRGEPQRDEGFRPGHIESPPSNIPRSVATPSPVTLTP